jgi:uncharacterized membrane protein
MLNIISFYYFHFIILVVDLNKSIYKICIDISKFVTINTVSN